VQNLGGWNPDGFTRQPRIGAVARVAAQKVIGDAVTDPVNSSPCRITLPPAATALW